MGYMKRRDAREAQEAQERAGQALHPPEFLPTHKLLNWPGCWLELCCACGANVLYPTKLLAQRYGNQPILDVLARARCQRCRCRPASAYLTAGNRTRTGGPPPDWAIELLSPE